MLSKEAKYSSVAAVILAMNVQLHATTDQVSYFDGRENQTLHVQGENFAPNHPECTVRKAVQAPIVTPAPAPEPAPAPKVEEDSDGDGVINSLDECPDTPKGYKVDTHGCPKSVTLHINFGFGSSKLPGSADKDIDILTKFLDENPAAKIAIIGHTDNVGKAAYNQSLSDARAKALAKRLVQNNIETGRISSMGKGFNEPIATNKTAEGRSQNRRIEVKIQ